MQRLLEGGIREVAAGHSLPSKYWDARSVTTSIAAKNKAREDLKRSAEAARKQQEHERYVASLPRRSKNDNYYQLGLQRKVIICEQIATKRNISLLKQELAKEQHQLKSAKKKMAHNITLKRKVKEVRKVAASLPRVVIPRRRVFVDRTTISNSPYVTFEEKVLKAQLEKNQQSPAQQEEVSHTNLIEAGAEADADNNTDITDNYHDQSPPQAAADKDAEDFLTLGINDFERDWVEAEYSLSLIHI